MMRIARFVDVPPLTSSGCLFLDSNCMKVMLEMEVVMIFHVLDDQRRLDAYVQIY